MNTIRKLCLLAVIAVIAAPAHAGYLTWAECRENISEASAEDTLYLGVMAQQWGTDFLAGRVADVTPEAREAFPHFSILAEANCVPAQVVVSAYELAGIRGAPDNIEGLKWLLIAKEEGWTGFSQEELDEAAASMDPEDVTKARRRAELWRQSY